MDNLIVVDVEKQLGEVADEGQYLAGGFVAEVHDDGGAVGGPGVDDLLNGFVRVATGAIAGAVVAILVTGIDVGYAGGVGRGSDEQGKDDKVEELKALSRAVK